MNNKENILCVDMDAFFVSVEQAINPSLKGLPVAVVGSMNRSVVVTSSYEARAKGVKTGMNINEAKKACPNLIFVQAKGRRYSTVSMNIAEFLYSISPNTAMFSIDEAFLDISGTGFSTDAAAYMIKSRIKRDWGITCTVGAGGNRLIAKMATHINKPDGYYNVPQSEGLGFIDSFKLKDLWGIGRSSVRKFESMGIFNASDMRGLGEEKLVEMLGVAGKNIFRLVSGLSDSDVTPNKADMKSMSHAMTFPADVVSKKEAIAYLLQLSEMVSSRARKNFYSGKVITLTVRRSDMSTSSFRYTLPFKTSATHHIYACVLSLFDKHKIASSPMRLLGVGLGGLHKQGAEYSNIEDSILGRCDKVESLYKVIDEVNKKFGERTIGYASVLQCKRKGHTVVSPSWQPTGDRSLDFENT